MNSNNNGFIAAPLTQNQTRILIGLFVILTIGTLLDILQDYTNHQESENDREEIKSLITDNTNAINQSIDVTEKVKDRLNKSSNDSKLFRSDLNYSIIQMENLLNKSIELDKQQFRNFTNVVERHNNTTSK